MERVSSPKDTLNERTSRYSSMQKSELEALAIAAIYEHRHLLAADEAVYVEWTRATNDPTMTSSVRCALQNEYLARQERSDAQQRRLSEIIDALGYVPNVPVDAEPSV